MLPIHVAVAVIQDAAGRVLLTRRPGAAHQGGLWEFPGGKVERGEDLAGALCREIREELGIEVSAHQPLINVTHLYPDKAVRLDVHRVLRYFGHPLGLEGQPLQWVLPEHLPRYAMPAADRPICTALRLPQQYLITGPDPAVPGQFLRRLEASLASGLRLVQLRAPGLARADYAALATEALALCRQHGAQLLLNCPVELALALDADGIHLNSQQLAGLSERPLTDDRWVAASCHNREEIRQAMAIDADFCVLSPVLPTTSHPTVEPLGWERFSQIVAATNIPVYALGGMDEDQIEVALEHGGQGIAAISALWAGDIR
ncbi:Nudix family hydrolase [Sedimenticola hydrogenitrophicus]|uniref:Nudix family hydrolase n=1 Tax=Sedimenticola hydrogenitrophicus TaxID=2967975 RepID=UPI0023B14AF1|nr:Nudix family hydrolase [Sedimenticola hydrogenitrophicus]